jgi:hypothetical protein
LPSNSNEVGKLSGPARLGVGVGVRAAFLTSNAQIVQVA